MKKTNLIIIIAMFIITSSLFVSGALTDNILLYASLDDNQATAIGNQANMSNNGSITAGSPTYGNTTCVLGGCRNSSGTNEIIAFANIIPLTSSMNFTLSAWIKGNCTPATKIVFANTNNYIDFAYTSQVSFRTNDGGGSSAVSSNCVIGNWEHYVGVHYSNGSSFLYKNGVLVNSIATTFGGSPTGNWQLFSGSGTFAKTQLDEVGLWNRALSSSEVATLYNNGTGLSYPFSGTPPVVVNDSINFISQAPSDLTTTSLFSTNILNITYNVSNITGLAYTYLNYTITTNPQRCVFFLNGTCYQQGNSFVTTYSISDNLSSMQNYIVNDNQIYPATYNLNETNVEKTVHDIKSLAGSNNYLLIPLKNVSDTTSYNQFEIYLNNTGTSELFYCNSSYIIGKPGSDNNCILFSSFSSTAFNHTHNQSKHNVFALPINTATGKIGTVKVTSTSQFIIRNPEYIGSTNNSCLAKYSTNSGSAYSNLTYCPDSHLHQYIGNEALNYSACMFNGNLTCSSLRSDIIDPINLAPTSPVITNPINDSQIVNEWLNITYTASSPSMNTTTITLYNISLLNSDLSFNMTLKSNNSLNLSYYWNTYLSQLSTGIYYIKVVVVDSNNNTNFDISESINITTNSRINISVKDYLSNQLVDTFSVNITDLTTGIKRSDSTTTNYTTFDVIKGRTYNVTADPLGYSYASATFTIPDNISKIINDTGTYTTSLPSPQNFIKTNLTTYINPKILSGNILMKADASTTTLCYINYSYIDGTSQNSSLESTSSTTYVSKSFTNPDPTKAVSYADLYCYKSGSNGISVTNHTITILYESTYFDAVVYSYTQNSISIYIYDEITLLPVNTQNITVQFIGDSSITRITDNGTLYIDNLTSGVWSVRFSGGNYTTKTYTITVNNKSTQTLNAYLTSTSYLVIFETTDISSGVPIENASFTMEKLINGSYVVTESKFTDIIGDAQFAYVPYTKYKFTVAKAGFNTKVFYLDPIIYATYTISLVPLATPSNPMDFDQVTVVYYPKFFYNNKANNFTFLISSPTGVLTNYGFNISYPGGSNATTGVNANGQTFVMFFNITGAKTFDKLNLTFNYSSTLSGMKTFRTSFEILNTAGIGNNTMIQLKDNTYGLGLMERAFITMLIVVIIAGLAYALVGVTGALLLGLIVHVMAVFFGFMPIGSILISLLIGFLMILANSITGGRQ
jgi:hypothetical protein